MAMLLMALVIAPMAQALPCTSMALNEHSISHPLVIDHLQRNDEFNELQRSLSSKTSHHQKMFSCEVMCTITSSVLVAADELVWNGSVSDDVLLAVTEILFSSQFYSPPVPPPWA